MDIEFIEEEHRDNIFKLMELCNVDMAEAYALYTNAGNNLQNAVQTKFNQNSNVSQNLQFDNNMPQRTYEEAFVPNHNSHFNDFGYGGQEKIGDDDMEYTNFKIFKQSGMNFGKRYNIKRSEGFIKSIMPKFLKPSSEQHFKKKLEEVIKRKSLLKVGTGSFSQSLQSIAKSKFPLIVHAYDFDPSLSQKLRQIYVDQQFTQTLNTQYQNYGLDCKQYELEDFLKEMIDLKNDRNSIIVMRINMLDIIQVVAKIKVQSVTLADLKKRFKQIKSNCIQLQMDELHLQKRYDEELKGNFDYQKPISMAQRRKLKQDRQIRKKQEEEFFQAMKQKPTQQKNIYKQQANLSNNQKNQTNLNSSKPQKQDILKKRKELRQNLKVYSQGPGTILIKLRMPSGQSIKLYVGQNQTAKYLFDYVNGLQSQQHGFENDLNRTFDIIRPYDKLNLSQKMNQSLKITFQDSGMESLVVTQRL